MKRRALALITTLPLLTTAACGGTDSATTGATGDTLAVTTSFYPLEYALQRVGGEHVTVTNLTKPGAEPHDLELTPKSIAGLQKADLVVYLSGFQPAVDEAAKDLDNAVDVKEDAKADLPATEDGHDHGGEEHAAEDEHAAEEHGEEEHADEHDHGDTDPHFWLDPMRYAGVAEALADELAAKDPEHKADYEKNAKAFADELTALDKNFATGLKSCKEKDLVTAHAAFGYLADRYGFEQVGITGLNPASEPSAKEMADVVEHIKEHKVSTVYAETLLPKDVAETIAKEANATVEVLDPIEAITDESAGTNYLEVMKSNLATLEKGQSCS